MENSKLNKAVGILIKLLGILAFLYCVKFAFSVPLFTAAKKPAFDLSFLVLLIMSILLFFYDSVLTGIKKIIDWVGNSHISKIKVSELEIELTALEKVLKDDVDKDGLLRLLKETFDKIDAKLKVLVQEYNLNNNITSAAIKNNPEKCAALLFTYDYMKPELLAIYLRLRERRAEILRNSSKINEEVLIRTIGLSMSLLANL